MSREQWAHGYWSGVKDAKNGLAGTYSEKARKCADSIILSIMDYEEEKGDYAVKSLNRIINIFRLSKFYSGEDRSTIRSALNYIWRTEPYGCYVAGEGGNCLDYGNDCLIVVEF